MDKQVISFNVNEQQLTRIGGECHYSSNKVSYIEAHFDLGANWDGFDSVRAVWFTDFVKGISTVLDADGICIVPTEVLRYKGKVSVNLVGSISVADVLTDRLTSYPITALVVDANARVESTETAEVTPSQFDQFVAIVRDEVEEVTGMTAEAETLPAGSEATASYSDGVLTFGIPRGEQGAKGDKGDTGDVGPQGPKGDTGDTGADGFSPIVTVTEITGGHEVSIEDSTQTQTFDVMDGTTPVIPWDSILPTDTASGSIASFPDGTDLVPCKSLQVALDPIQDLNGYDKPWSGGASAQMIPNGTDTSNGYVAGQVLLEDNQTVNNSDAYISEYFAVTAGQDYAYSAKSAIFSPAVCFYDANKNFISGVKPNGANPKVMTAPSNAVYARASQYNDGYSNMTQFEKGTSKTDIVPYSNICPISGRTEVVTSRCGKNLLDKSILVNGDYNGQGSSFAHNVVTDGYLPIKGGQTYMWSQNASVAGRYLRFYDENMVLDASGNIPQYNAVNVTFTAPSWAHYMKVMWYSVSEITADGIKALNPQIELGSTATTYEAFNGTTHTTSLGRTVYGGTLDVVSGELVVTDANIASYNGETLPSTWISDRDVYASGTTPTTGAQVVYKLSEPQTYQLTPTEVSLLLGNNNVWSDGDVTVVYNADIQRYIEKKLS